jgi:hypothetical protein
MSQDFFAPTMQAYWREDLETLPCSHPHVLVDLYIMCVRQTVRKCEADGQDVKRKRDWPDIDSSYSVYKHHAACVQCINIA